MTADELLAAVKRRVFAPTSQATFTDAEILSIADEAMSEVVVPMVMSVREEFYVWEWDQPITGGSATSGTTYRVPSRAIGSKLRDVALLDDAGRETGLARLSPDDLEFAPAGFYLRGGYITLFSTQGPLLGTALRMRLFVRPGSLVLTTDAAKTRGISSAGTTTILYAGATGWVTAQTDRIDVVRGSNPHDSIILEAYPTNVVGATITPTSVLTNLPLSCRDVTPNQDYVALSGYSPFVQAPVEAHPVLAQAVAVKMLEALGDGDGMQAAQAKLDESVSRCTDLLAVRTDGAPKKVVNRISPYRRRW